MFEDRLPFLKTTLPPALRYPLPERAFDFAEAMIGLVYGDHSLTARIVALTGLIRALLKSGGSGGSSSQQGDG